MARRQRNGKTRARTKVADQGAGPWDLPRGPCRTRAICRQAGRQAAGPPAVRGCRASVSRRATSSIEIRGGQTGNDRAIALGECVAVRRAASGLAMLAALAFCLPATGRREAQRWGKSYFPDAKVVTQDGKTLRFYDDLIKDKVFVISFLFTTCKDICPLATARLAELQDKLGDSMGRDIFFYSISIDPETDTPARLKQYADAFGAGPGWLFLTGSARRHPRHPPQAGRTQQGLERAPQRGAARQRGHRRVGQEQRCSATSKAWRCGAQHGSEVAPGRGCVAPAPGDRGRPRGAARAGLVQAAVRRLPQRRERATGSGRISPASWGAGIATGSSGSSPTRRRCGCRRTRSPSISRRGSRAVRMPAMGISARDAADLLAYIVHLEAGERQALAQPLEVALRPHHAYRG